MAADGWETPPDSELCESFDAAMAGIKYLDLEGDASRVQQHDKPRSPKKALLPDFFGDSSDSCATATTVDTVTARLAYDEARVFPGTEDDFAGDGAQNGTVDEANLTTLMIRNIPRKYTQRQLLSDLNEQYNFVDGLDFFYLPADLGTGRNLGYCFINFIHGEDALRVKQALHKLRLFAGAKSGLSIGFADVQGLESNLRNVRRSLMHRIKNRDYRPLVVSSSGELVPIST